MYIIIITYILIHANQLFIHVYENNKHLGLYIKISLKWYRRYNLYIAKPFMLKHCLLRHYFNIYLLKLSLSCKCIYWHSVNAHTFATFQENHNVWCFRPRFCTCNTGPGQPGLMRLILLWIMPLVQDRSLDLLTNSSSLPLYYGCPSKKIIKTDVHIVWIIDRNGYWIPHLLCVDRK